MEKVKFELPNSYHTVGNKMKSDQFLYWMQGAFELAEKNTLSSKQVQILKKHIEIAEDDHKFITWLKGFLVGRDNGINKKDTLILKEELEKCFLNLTKEKESSLSELLKQFPKKDPPPFFPNPPYPWLDKDWKFKPGDIIC